MEKDLWVLVDGHELEMFTGSSEGHRIKRIRFKRIMVKRRVVNGWREMILTFCSSLVRVVWWGFTCLVYFYFYFYLFFSEERNEYTTMLMNKI